MEDQELSVTGAVGREYDGHKLSDEIIKCWFADGDGSSGEQWVVVCEECIEDYIDLFNVCGYFLGVLCFWIERFVAVRLADGILVIIHVIVALTLEMRQILDKAFANFICQVFEVNLYLYVNFD